MKSAFDPNKQGKDHLLSNSAPYTQLSPKKATRLKSKILLPIIN